MRKAAPAPPPPAPANVDHAREDAASTTPHLPHDRDESVGMTDGKPSEIVKRGHDDVERGVKDTTRATEADQAYDKLKKR